MGCSVPTPTSRNRQKDVGSFGDEFGLLFGGKKQVAVALPFGSERGEDSSAHAKISMPHVRAFFSALKTECESAKISRFHLWTRFKSGL
jgi:hypothetical protein